MGAARLVGTCGAVLFAVAGCAGPPEGPGSVAVVTDSVRAAVDSILEERPDSVTSTPTDSTTLRFSLLPSAPGGPLDADATALAERAVFVPRTQRWFMVRQIDSAAAMDVGRIDGGVGTSAAARAALDRMLAAGSPVQPGMTFIMHPHSGAASAHVTRLRVYGRRILALLDAPAIDSAERAVPTEWRGATAVPSRPAADVCASGDTSAISATLSRYVAGPKEALSVIRGCFGAFRALIAIRPLEITPESIERVILVRASGKTRGGRLRDLSYPLHELVGVTDVDGDGTHEIVVRSFRPAMETWAALRMTDSVSFTRFASGFTIEKR